MPKWKLLIYISMLIVSTTIVLAEEESDVIKLDEIIVSATRTQSSLDKVSASSSVISEKQINDSTANDVGDLLSATNIVQILDYGPASLASASLRGSTAAQVLVLVDGRRINDSRAGGADLDGISTSNIKRIEIIRGGQSAMYGADAVGGIINIITKRPEKLNAKAWSNFASYGLRSYGLELGEHTKYLSSTFSLSKTDSESDFPFQNKFGENLIRKNANYDRRNVSAKVTFDTIKSAILDLSASHYYSNSGSPGLMGFYTSEAVRRDKTNDISLNFEHEPISAFSYKIIAYDRMSFMRYIDPTYPYQSDDTHKVDTKSAEIQAYLLKNTKIPIVGGAQVMNENINSTAIENRHRETFSLYAQQELSRDINISYLKTVSIFPAVRWDYYSDFNAGLSPKIGILASLGDILTLRLNAGKSYRAPTMNDLYWPSSAMTSGNPDLKPERSIDADAGFQIHIQRSTKNVGLSLFRISASYFQNDITDGIQWTPGQNGKWTPLNFAKINTKGIETEGHIQLSIFNVPDLVSIDGNYTFLNAKDALGKQIIYRPQHSIGYSVRIGVDNLWFQDSGLYQSKRYYTTENTKWLDPFMKHDFQVGIERRLWDVTKIGLSVDLKNVFNKQYQLISDYPLPGREWSFKMYIGSLGR
jgi:vitamin B12 transporter